MEHVVDYVGVNLHTWVIDFSVGRRAQVRDACCRGANQHNLVLESSRGQLVLNNIGDRVVRVSSPRAMVIDGQVSRGIRLDEQGVGEIDANDSGRIVVHGNLVRAKPQVKPHGLHFERTEELPLLNILGAAKREHQHGPAQHAVCVRRNVEEANGSFFNLVRVRQGRDVCNVCSVEIPVSSVALNELEIVLLPCLRMKRVPPEGVPLDQFVILIQNCRVDPFQFAGFEKEITEYYGAESIDGLAELRIGIELCCESADLCLKFWVHGFATFFSLFQFRPEGTHGVGGAVRFVKRNIEGDYLGATVVKRVEHGSEMRPGEGPLAQHFLRLLVDFHDDNAGIRWGCAGRPVTEASVQRVVFKALEKGKDGSSSLTEEGEVIQRERGERNGD